MTDDEWLARRSKRTARRKLIKQNKERFTKNGVPGFIYAIRCGELVKIGVSQKPLDRLRNLQTVSPVPLELIGCRRFANVYSWESFFHRKLSAFKVRGEWFDLPKSLESGVLRRLGMEKTLPPQNSSSEEVCGFIIGDKKVIRLK